MEIELMPFRAQELEASLAGYRETGVMFVAKKSQNFFPAGFSDDLGIYGAVPLISQIFGVKAVTGFELLLLFTSLLAISAVGVYAFFAFKSWMSRGLALFMATTSAYFSLYNVGDVYAFGYLTAMLVIPSFALLLKYSQKKSFVYMGLIGLGLILGVGHILRKDASLPVLVFIGVSLLLIQTLKKSEKLVWSAVIATSFLSIQLGFQQLLSVRDHFLVKHTSYDASQMMNSHPLWHSVYIGLGYYKNNPLGIAYGDHYAQNAVSSIDPQIGYLSPRYEQVLKEKVIKTTIDHPFFVAQNLIRKFISSAFKSMISVRTGFKIFDGIHLLAILLGIIFIATAMKTQNTLKSKENHIPFLLAITIASAPGVLVIPAAKYIMSMVALTNIYAAYFFLTTLDKHPDKSFFRLILKPRER